MSEMTIAPDSLQKENDRLRRAVEELSTLNELARAIGASLNSQEIMRVIIRSSVRAVHAEQAVVTLIDREHKDIGVTLTRTVVGDKDREKYHLGQSIMGWMQLYKKPLLSNDLGADERFRKEWKDSNVHSVVCVPLMVRSELTGILSVYNKQDNAQFTNEDQRLLSIIAGQSAQIIENARLFESQKEMIRMQEELRVAERIQKNLLPHEPPVFEGYDLAGMNRAARSVGGDYFDFIPVDDDRIGICLADVSGKGVPASLLMANIQAIMRTQVLIDPSPSSCLNRANVLLSHNTGPETFATMFYCLLDRSSHSLTYACAGQDHPFHLRAGDPLARLTEGGVPLGVLDDFEYSEHRVELQPGSTIVVSSDGIAEAFNAEGGMFSDAGVQTLLGDGIADTADGIMHQIISAVDAFAGKTPQSDDMTVVVLRRLDSGT